MTSSALFFGRLHRGRIRQLAISGISVLAALVGLVEFSPDEVGAFAFYTVILLLVLNALLALIQLRSVIAPAENLLNDLQSILARLDAEELKEIPRLAHAGHSAFTCLAEAMDDVIAALLERIRRGTAREMDDANIFCAIPIGLAVVGREGEVRRIVRQPLGALPLPGVRVGQIPDPAVWGVERLAKFQELLHRIFTQDLTLWSEFELTDGAHTPHVYRMTLRRMTDETALVAILDVAESNRELVRATREANDTSRTQRHAAMRRFAASVAHDGKNVFAALNNILEINRQSTDPLVREQVPLAEDAIRRGLGLMRELTSLAGETKFHLACHPADKAFLALSENPTIHALCPENVKIFTRVSDKPIPEIDIDLDQAWKIPFNLVKNSVEAFGHVAGRIWMTAEPCNLTEADAASFRHSGRIRMGAGALFTFTDDGPGIPPAMVSRLFDPYFSSKGEGRGLGLSTVMTIVDAHGAALRVTSAPGRGTSFAVYFPASRNTEEELRMVREVAPNGEILLVDDDPAILHTTALVLKTLKIAAHPAANAEDALVKLHALRTRVRTVVMDANLSGTSSAALAKTIRDGYPDLPIVVMSGASEEMVRDLFRDAPFDRYLAKPFSVRELAAAIEGTPVP